MLQNDYERRFLAQHNAGRSDGGRMALSPQTTPTKKGGDRFIPVRQPEAEWSLRFAALSDDVVPLAGPSAPPVHSRASANNSGVHSPRRGVSGAESTASLNAAGTAARALDASESSNRGEMAAHRALLRNELLKSCIDDVAVAQKWENGGFRGGDCETSKEATVTSLSFTGSMVGITAASSSRPLVAVASAPQMSSNGGNASPLPMPLGHNASATGLFQYGFNKTPTKTPPRQGGSSCGTPRTSPRTENQQNGSPLVSPGLLGSKSAPPKSYHFGNRPPVPMGSPAVRNLSALYSLSPLSENSHRLLRSPRKPPRKIPKNPYKVLDAPELQDDFYLNLVDWSSQNVLAVGLGHCVYLWSAANSQVVKLCDLASEGDDLITAVQWSERGDLLAVGTSHGLLHVWDTTQTKKILNRPGHLYRIGCIAWNGDLACSGSRDRTILQRDIRAPENSAKERKLLGHKQEVCGLKWSPDHQFLASGGNDNQLLIWSLRKDQPVQTYVEHVAAVKALAWSPHQHGLLVSGGGTADRCLRFWNTLTGQAMQKIDTGSQVCNVAWSRHTRELVSTHGYSQNQIVIWKYPSLGQVAKLTGHTTRVLYLATSPDGESIVTGAGDETLRFWHVFNKQRNPKEERSQLNFYMSIR